MIAPEAVAVSEEERQKLIQVPRQLEQFGMKFKEFDKLVPKVKTREVVVFEPVTKRIIEEVTIPKEKYIPMEDIRPIVPPPPPILLYKPEKPKADKKKKKVVEEIYRERKYKILTPKEMLKL